MSLDSSHWYTRTGEPCHTQLCKSKTAKNPTRPTNLTDARKLDLLPSVSGYTKMLYAPQLESYKLSNLAGVCFDNPPGGGEDRNEWISAMVAKSKEDAKGAADVGTLVHAALEACVTGAHYSRDEELVLPSGEKTYMRQMVEPAMAMVAALDLQVLRAEGVLINNKEGYAGTTDLILGTPDNFAIVDFKTKRTKVGEKIVPIDTHPMQLMAYARAFSGSREPAFIANLYISTTEVGRVELVRYTPEEQGQAWQAFLACTELYRYINNYDARSLT